MLPVAACKFPELPAIDVDAATDAPADAPPTCVPDTIVCDDALGVYTDCSIDGSVELQIRCSLGCDPNMEKCVDIDPSNGLATYLDMASAAPDLVLQGTTVIDTAAGTIFVDGESVVVPRFLAAGGIRVFAVRSLMISGTTTIVPDNGNPALAFVSDGDVVITGLLDVSANGSQGGPKAYWGGPLGGEWECAGGYSVDAVVGAGGAGGAGGAQIGGDGGDGAPGQGAAGGTALVAVEPLRGGCEGGTATGVSAYGDGGGGGGALQITSRTRIELRTSGVIDASGGGARQPAGSRRAGGGGGAGGNVVLEAPQVILDGPGVVVSTKGGGGAGAGTSPASNGSDGGYDDAPAPGGTSEFQSHGGRGGTATSNPFPGEFAMGAGYEGGGGGGAVGTTLFRTTAGAIVPVNGAAIRSGSSVEPLRTRTIVGRPLTGRWRSRGRWPHGAAGGARRRRCWSS